MSTNTSGAGPDKRLSTSFPIQFAGLLFLVFLLKLPTLFDPPMWDTATGLFPAALMLSQNGFDLGEVLSAPGYGVGGPNTHATSPITLLTAVVLRLGGAQALTLLHLIHYGITALGLTFLYRLAQPALGTRNAAVLTIASLVFPLFFVQAGRLYMEMPLFLCAAGMLYAHANGRLLVSIVWASAAFAVKENGIVVPATLAVLLLMEPRPMKERLLRTTMALAPSVVILGFPAMMALGNLTNGEQPTYQLFPAPMEALARLGRDVERFLFRVPDVLVLMILFVVSLPSQIPDLIRGLGSPAPASIPDSQGTSYRLRLKSSLTLLIAAYLGLYFVALPLVANFTLILPRYHTLVVPFLILWIALRIDQEWGPRITLGFLGALILLGAVNHRGILYPSDVDTAGQGSDFALTERSMAYRDLNRIRVEAWDHLVRVAGDHPAFYGHYEHYLNHYPGLGYTPEPLSNGRLMHQEHQWRSVVQESPCAFALYNEHALGGERIRTLAEEAAPALGMDHDTVAVYSHGPYVAIIHRFQRTAGACQD